MQHKTPDHTEARKAMWEWIEKWAEVNGVPVHRVKLAEPFNPADLPLPFLAPEEE